MELARWIVIALAFYLAVGTLFALPFAMAWVGRLSPGARGSGWAFRVLIVPGAALFWPLLALRLVRDTLPPGPAGTGDHP